MCNHFFRVKEDTNAAVKSAKDAFETWKETTKEDRLHYLEKLLSIYKKRFGEMAEAISLEMGAPIDWASRCTNCIWSITFRRFYFKT